MPNATTLLVVSVVTVTMASLAMDLIVLVCHSVLLLLILFVRIL